MHVVAKLSCACTALLAVLNLHGCGDGVAQQAPPGTPKCSVSAVIVSGYGSATGGPISVTWAQDFYYNNVSDDVAVCNKCCSDIQTILSTSNYTSLCAQKGNVNASLLYQTCRSGCPSIVLPPAGIDHLCEPCAPGRWSASARGNCTPCAAGRWSPQGATSCINCAHGRFSATLAAPSVNTCLDCAAGHSSYLSGVPITGATICEICPSGTWRSTGMGLCEPCPAGTWTNVQGLALLSGCTSCSAGRWSNTTAATAPSTCVACGPGRWSATIGAVNANACIGCTAGRWSSSIGQVSASTCQACGAGTWSTTVGASSAVACTSCEPGKWSAGIGSGAPTTCQLCVAGRYGTQVGATSIVACKSCAAGRFNAMQGVTECAVCAEGKYSAQSAWNCSLCEPGRFQSASAATACVRCPGGTFNTISGAIDSSTCASCARGSYSGSGASLCTPCEVGKYSLLGGVTACVSCAQGSITPAGAFQCCPSDSAEWPVKQPLSLSIAPGKYWTNVHFVADCTAGSTNGAKAIDIDSGAASMSSHGSRIFVATLKKGKLHSCVQADCGGTTSCGVLPATEERLMPGKLIHLAAFVEVYGTSSLHQCQQVVEVGFVGFGCETGTVLTFLLALVLVVSLTMLLGLAFERIVRSRQNYYVETSLQIKTTSNHQAVLQKATSNYQAGSQKLPSIEDLRNDVQSFLKVSAPEWHLTSFGAWKIEDFQESNAAIAVQVDLKVWSRHGHVLKQREQLRQLFASTKWVAGKCWLPAGGQVESQPPAFVREAAKLPGADLMEAAEMATVRILSCGGNAGSKCDMKELHTFAAREILQRLMSPWCLYIIAVQASIHIVMIILLPAIGFKSMTCSDGYPKYLHVVWGVYLLASSGFTTWLLLRELLTRGAASKLFSKYRIRIGLRFAAMLISVTDIYQDATFPVIAGRCGFDLWWVSLWLVFLGVGVMQILVQIILIFKLRQRYHKATTPEEKERTQIEAIFLALRATDNHVIVYAVKPAVEERLGGSSSWTMKLMEARVAFLRFVFEDAEQSALQASFLLFFDQATLSDKVWVGFSTGTSLLLSFVLTVQTLPEVRDWLWFQFLTWFPGGARWTEARILWLLALIMCYRLLSIFPWLGSCTPAGDHNDNTLRRLLLFSDQQVPSSIKVETFAGTMIAFAVGCVIIAIFLYVWRVPLRIPRHLFCRWRGARRNSRDGALVGMGAFQPPEYNGEQRFARAGALSVEKEQDSDSWLESLRTLSATADAAKSDRALKLISEIDRMVFDLVHITCLHDLTCFEAGCTDVIQLIVDLEGVRLPQDSDAASPSTSSLLEALNSEVSHSLDVALVRGRVSSLLRDPEFRRAGLRTKAQKINDVTEGTEGAARLMLLHWSVLEKLGQLPEFGDGGPGAEDAIQLLDAEKRSGRSIVVVYLSHAWEREDHPDTPDHVKARTLVLFAQWLDMRAKRQQLDCDVYFWVDYCCMDARSDIGIQALPLYIAASSEILTWKTANFNRRCWTMLERLLAYSFCPGGLTPFAINGSSFQSIGAAAETDSEDEIDGAYAVRPLGAATKVVPVTPETLEMSRIRTHYRTQKLPDPTDPNVCRLPTFLAAANLERRRANHLVQMALAVPALEVFADRQPVEFGLTEVVEQFLGPFTALDFRSPSGIGEIGDWLEAKGVSQAPQEWHVEVKKPGSVHGNHKKLNYQKGDEEGTIVVLDHEGLEESKGPAPTPDEITHLLKAVDEAYMAQISGMDSNANDLEENAIKLVQALQADLASAIAADNEKLLSEALQRSRDVDLPIRAKAAEQLCKLQVAEAIASGDLHALQMAVRFAIQHNLESLPEVREAKTQMGSKKKDQLRDRAVAVMSQDDPDFASIVSVLDVAHRRGWDDIASDATKALVAGAGDARHAGGVAKLAKLHRLAKEQEFDVVVAHTSKALAGILEKAVEDKDALTLCRLLSSAEGEGITETAESASQALTQLSEHWKKTWKESERKMAKAGFDDMIAASRDCHLRSIESIVSTAMSEAQKYEESKRSETQAVVRNAKTVDDFINAATTSKQWVWNDVFDYVLMAWKEKINNIDSTCRDVAGVANLAEMHNRASEHHFSEMSSLTSRALLKRIETVTHTRNAAALLQIARVMEEHGVRNAAAEARKSLNQLVNDLKEFATTEDGDALAALREAARRCGDTEVVELADGAISAAAAMEKEKKNIVQADLHAATDGEAMFKIMDSAIGHGWMDIAMEAFGRLESRVESVMKQGIQGMSEVAKIHDIAKKQRAHDVVQLTGNAFSDCLAVAQRGQDGVTLLWVARAAESQNCRDIADRARRLLAEVLKGWKRASCTKIPDGVQAFADAAGKCGEKDSEVSAKRLLDAAARCREAGRVKNGNILVEVARDAAQGGFTGVRRDAENFLEHVVQDLKKSLDIDTLRSLRDSSKRIGVVEFSKALDNYVELADRMSAAKLVDDFTAIINAARAAGRMDWGTLARDARNFLLRKIAELQKNVKKNKDSRKILHELHEAARNAGLDDVADATVNAIGDSLPADWTVRNADGKKEGFLLKKVKAAKPDLIYRIQQMVDATFKGWGFLGTDCCTRDRPKSKNPLASRLKVEEVIHVENTENFLNYNSRREQVIADMHALPDGTLRGDYRGTLPMNWDVKTRLVSMKGVWRHPEEPVDISINECWLWHGTSEAGVAGITDTDFDMGRAGSATGSMFGRGLYFAESVLKADEYTRQDARGWSPLLLCRVVLGRVKYCDHPQPWSIQGELEASIRCHGFHSVLGDREKVRGTFKEFIVFDNDQVYPEYIVWYSRQAPIKATYP